MNETTQHAEWLNLIDRTGPFLSPLVLEGAFPQGLDKVETALRKRLRDAYSEWRDAVEETDSDLQELHLAWVQLVLKELLEFDDEILLVGDNLPETLSYTSPEHGATVRPDMALDTNGRTRLLVTILEPDTDPNTVVRGEIWPASPVERMTLLCRATGVSLGLVTDGERWTLVFAPKDGPAEYGTWYAHYWRREPITLQAFASLLNVRRFFGPEASWPETLLGKSLEYQDEITDTLGEQVRRAVEMLVQAIDRADIERNRELLRDVRPAELYEAGLTVMMRLVFLLCAEERGLLLLGDEAYDRHYAVSTLRAQLGEDASRVGLEVLERRHDAWSRLLATFRGIYGGISHEALRLPALGGSLFDPDRFSFLEGRAVGSSWRETSAFPLPIDNGTVLALLRALQILEQHGGAQTLSYKALDVEQVGYVYEGLLEQTVARVPETTLGLVGSQKAKRSDVLLSSLEQARAKSDSDLIDLLVDITARSKPALTNLLIKEVDEELTGKILLTCGGDAELAARVKKFGHLLRTDLWGAPLVYRKGAFAVTFGTDRRESGSHYTPKVLTEKIVAETLEPVTYVGPTEGHSREEWQLKSSEELLDLKVCDPAMGSGAFLVQVCRWLGQRLVEAWGQAEIEGSMLTIDGDVVERLGGAEPMSDNAEERLLLARRLIAERCLYGVDFNPLAVELAKLSIWLVTLAKGRPFGFLDHNLRNGDSLLGVHRLEQVTDLDMDPGKDAQGRSFFLFAKKIRESVKEATVLRKSLREVHIRDIRDVESMACLDDEAKRVLEPSERISDALVGDALAGSDVGSLSLLVGPYLDGDSDAGQKVLNKSAKSLNVDLPSGRLPRKPFHWPLEFPEVFSRENGGFDAIVGNPPFVGGKKISGVAGSAYRDYLVRLIADGSSGSADLVAYFFLRAYSLLRNGASFGLLAVNTIAEGETRQVGLERILKMGAAIFAAYPNEPWPGKAAVVTSRVHLIKKEWIGKVTLSGKKVDFISAFLSDREEWSPKPLIVNAGKSFIGSYVLGKGFIITEMKAKELISLDPQNKLVLYPYLNAQDLNSHHNQEPTRWVINFWDWPLSRDAEGSWGTANKGQHEKWLKVCIVPNDFPGYVASDFPDVLAIIEKNVRPERQRKKKDGKYVLRSPLPTRWWHYADKRPALYHAIGKGDLFSKHPPEWSPPLVIPSRIIAIARHTKYFKPALVTNNLVASDATAIFCATKNLEITESAVDLSSNAEIAFLNSSVVEAWIWKQSSRIGQGLRFTPSDCIETLPWPSMDDELFAELSDLGLMYSTVRSLSGCGITDLYNKFNSQNINETNIDNLRDLQTKINYIICLAYGWNDIDLDHGYHEVAYLPENDRIRYTISEEARVEILDRLALLNKKRYETEVAQGLHPLGSGKKKPAKSATHKATSTLKPDRLDNTQSVPQLDLFTSVEPALKSVVDSGVYWLDGAADKILEWLEDHEGWHLKETVLQGSGVGPSKWDESVAKLLESGGIQVRGAGDGRRYRVNM